MIIQDWKENNYLRGDRYTPSKYLLVYQVSTKCQPSGIPTVDQGKVRKEKVRVRSVKIKTELEIKEDLIFEEILNFGYSKNFGLQGDK